MKIQLPTRLYHYAESAKNTLGKHGEEGGEGMPKKTESEIFDQKFTEARQEDLLNKKYPFAPHSLGDVAISHRVSNTLAQKTIEEKGALPNGNTIQPQFEHVDFENPEHPLSQTSFNDGVSQALEKAGIPPEKILGLKGFMENAGEDFWLNFLNTPAESFGGSISGKAMEAKIGPSYDVVCTDPAYGIGEVFGKILAGFASGELGREYYDQFSSNMQKVFQDIFTPNPQSGKNGDTVASVWPPDPHSHPGIQGVELTV